MNRNRNRIGLYIVSSIWNRLEFSKEFSLIKTESSWYCGSFCVIEKCQSDRIFISFANVKYMLKLRLIYKTGKHRYSFRLKEFKKYYDRLKDYNKKLMLHYYGPNRELRFNPFIKQGGKTRPIITDYRYKANKRLERLAIMERANNRHDEEDSPKEFVPPKVKIKTKPWAYNRQKVQRELQKDFLS